MKQALERKLSRLQGKTQRFFQRRFRGWDDSECWSLDHTFACWITPRLEVLKKNKHGVPNEVFDDPAKWNHTDEEMAVAEKKWDDILDKMILGFSIKANQFKEGGAWDIYEAQILERARNGEKFSPFTLNHPLYTEAKELFAKYLDNLWD